LEEGTGGLGEQQTNNIFCCSYKNKATEVRTKLRAQSVPYLEHFSQPFYQQIRKKSNGYPMI